MFSGSKRNGGKGKGKKLGLEARSGNRSGEIGTEQGRTGRKGGRLNRTIEGDSGRQGENEV